MSILPFDAPPPAALEAEPLRFGFVGHGPTVMGLHLQNLFWTLLSGGLYYFWGKARLQRHVCSQITVAGDRLAYMGTGKEFFLGWLRAAAVVAAVLIAERVIEWHDRTEWQLWGLGFFYVAALLLTPVATVGVLRFRLSRTDWRGVRFSFRGTVRGYAPIFYREALWLTLTLGLYYPHFNANTRRYLTGHTYLGDRAFAYDGRGEDLMGEYIKAVARSVPTLGLFWGWMQARQEAYDWSHTTLGEARFDSAVTGGGLTWLWASNMALVVGTLGLGWPWAKLRALRYQLRCLSLAGPLDLDGVGRDERRATATGEQLGEAMGTLDGGIGF